MDKLTDGEIIKAFECCETGDCDNCPLVDVGFKDCLNAFRDYINRQKAEKEALIAGQETLQNHIAEKLAEIEKLNIELKAMRGAANSYKAEIERLRKETKLTIDSIRKLAVESIKDAKSEAIKEFAERYYLF